MTAYLQTVAGALVAVILCCVVSRQGKDLSLLMALAACAMVLTAAFGYLEPVVAFIRTLKETARMDEGLFQTVLKAVGIGLISQIAGLICTDSGSASVGKAVELLGAAVILWLSLPLMTALLELVQQMVGNL